MRYFTCLCFLQKACISLRSGRLTFVPALLDMSPDHHLITSTSSNFAVSITFFSWRLRLWLSFCSGVDTRQSAMACAGLLIPAILRTLVEAFGTKPANKGLREPPLLSVEK